MATAPVKNVERPGPPKFVTVEEERRHRKERLAASFRLFSKFGFVRRGYRAHHGA